MLIIQKKIEQEPRGGRCGWWMSITRKPFGDGLLWLRHEGEGSEANNNPRWPTDDPQRTDEPACPGLKILLDGLP